MLSPSQPPSSKAEQDKVWHLIKEERSALLVTVGEDGVLGARPMGCLQKTFEGTLWFITFRRSGKLTDIHNDEQVLIAYARPKRYEYVEISGRARVVEDRARMRELWREGLRVWFPKGLDDPLIALIEVEVETARYWTRPASLMAYAWLYAKARIAGKRASTDAVADTDVVRFRSPAPQDRAEVVDPRQ